MRIVIDGSGIGSEEELHEFLHKALGYGQFYGRNIAALRDFLGGGDPRPVEIIWIKQSRSRSVLGNEVVEQLDALFREVEQEDLRWGWKERLTYSVST